jgi:hypothetical protein
MRGQDPLHVHFTVKFFILCIECHVVLNDVTLLTPLDL